MLFACDGDQEADNDHQKPQVYGGVWKIVFFNHRLSQLPIKYFTGGKEFGDSN